jgi:hypothetical protein
MLITVRQAIHAFYTVVDFRTGFNPRRPSNFMQIVMATQLVPIIGVQEFVNAQ